MQKERLKYEAYIKQARLEIEEEKLKASESPVGYHPVATDTEETVVNALLKGQKKAASTLTDDMLNSLMDEMIESVQDKRALLRKLSMGHAYELGLSMNHADELFVEQVP